MSFTRHNRGAAGSRSRGADAQRRDGATARPAVQPEERLEDREVRSADPELSPQTNAMLTEELREVVGAERARVPADRPHATEGERPSKHSVTGYLGQNRFQLIRAAAITLTFAAIVALTTGTWWILPLAAGVHALGTMMVVLTVARMTTSIEHPSPDVAAALAEEGVASPDERFSQMVEEFSDVPQGGAGELLSAGYNDRETPASESPARAMAEQSTAMTPTEDPSESSGESAMPDYFIWTTAAALFVLSIVLPATMGGGWMWLLTAVMVPLLIGWTALQWLMIKRPEHARLQGRGALALVAGSTALAAAVFCLVVAIAYKG